VIDWSRFEHGNRLVIHAATTRTFIRSPGFEHLDDVRNWLLAQGVRESDQRIERGTDGLYRGSGEVTS
jgi:hypothetical protein